jgi:hypothetical protein
MKTITIDEKGSALAIDGVFLYKKNATGISTATISEPAADAAVYSLSGQKVGAGYHGVVIKNGRKYIQ